MLIRQHGCAGWSALCCLYMAKAGFLMTSLICLHGLIKKQQRQQRNSVKNSRSTSYMFEVIALLLFRFLMLCIHCNYGTLRQLALDTIGNLAAQLILEPIDSWRSEMLCNLLLNCLTSTDKFAVVRGKRVGFIWAAWWQNQQNGMCAQRRLRSAWASAQCDQSSLCAQWIAKDQR